MDPHVQAPLISIALSVKAASTTLLSRAVDSVLAQTFRNFELLIMDDGSSPAVGQWLDALAGREPRVVLKRHPASVGLTQSLCELVGVARGEWLARIDGDDFWAPSKLEKQLQYLGRYPGTVLLGTWIKNIVLVPGREEQAFEQRPDGSSEELKAQLFTTNPFAHSSVLIQFKAYTEAGGYDPSYKTTQDLDLWFRLAPLGRFGIVQENLVTREVGPTSLSRGWTSLIQVQNGLRTRLRNLFRFKKFELLPAILWVTLEHFAYTLAQLIKRRLKA